MLSNFLFSKPKNVGNAKCRPTIDRVSTNYWPIQIGQVSTNYRRSIGEVSAKSRRSVGEREAISAEIHLERLSTVSLPSVDPLSTDYRPLCRPSVDRVSTDCRPSVDRLSTDCRPLYRPICRSTLPTVNKIPFLLLRKSFKRVQCSDEFTFNSHIRCYDTQWSMTMWWPQQFVQTPSPRKKTLHTK